MGANKGRGKRPGSCGGRNGTEEEVDEEGRAAVDANVDKVLVVHLTRRIEGSAITLCV